MEYRRFRFFSNVRFPLVLCIVATLIFMVIISSYSTGPSNDSISDSMQGALSSFIAAGDEEIASEIEGSRKIAIVIIIKGKDVSQYQLALETVECYAAHHGYPFHLIDVAVNLTFYNSICPMKDLMFQRHCVLVHHMTTWKNIDWVLFLDADMAVINPRHHIEEYLPTDPSTSVVFYDRIMNYEVMAGSYMVRNDALGRLFLSYWAFYAYKLPNSFHGTDNGAIHNVLLDFALGNLVEERKACEKIWSASRDFSGLYAYEACFRAAIANSTMDGIELRNKASGYCYGVRKQDDSKLTHPQRWARDGWLTDNLWAPSDFIVHGWQKRRLNKKGFAGWRSPLVRSPWEVVREREGSNGTLSQEAIRRHCEGEDYESLWDHDSRFISNESEVAKRIGRSISAQKTKLDKTIQKLRSSRRIKF